MLLTFKVVNHKSVILMLCFYFLQEKHSMSQKIALLEQRMMYKGSYLARAGTSAQSLTGNNALSPTPHPSSVQKPHLCHDNLSI